MGLIIGHAGEGCGDVGPARIGLGEEAVEQGATGSEFRVVMLFSVRVWAILRPPRKYD
ncbi:hypothetical protein ACFSLT_19090 [Novosphingobium resinovorum]